MSDRLDALLAGYRDHAPSAFRAPEFVTVQRRARRYRVRRLGAVAAAAAAVMLGVAVGLPDAGPPPPADGPAPVATSIYAVDWTNTELTVPANPDQDCPAGRVRLYHRYAPGTGWIGTSDPALSGDVRALVTRGRVTFGDLTGDAAPEAVLGVRCVRHDMGDQMGQQLLVVRMLPDHTLEGIGFVGTVSAEYPEFGVDDGMLRVQLRYNHASPTSYGSTFWDTAFTRVYRWNGSGFDHVAGRTDPLNFTAVHQGYGVPSQLAELRAANGEVLCPAALVPFGKTLDGTPYPAGGYRYSLGEWSVSTAKADVDGDGDEELIVPIRCTGAGHDAVSLYVLAQGSDRFVTLDVPLVGTGAWTLGQVRVLSGRLEVHLAGATGSGAVYLTWAGDHFELDNGLPPEFGPPGTYRTVS